MCCFVSGRTRNGQVMGWTSKAVEHSSGMDQSDLSTSRARKKNSSCRSRGAVDVARVRLASTFSAAWSWAAGNLPRSPPAGRCRCTQAASWAERAECFTRILGARCRAWAPRTTHIMARRRTCTFNSTHTSNMEAILPPRREVHRRRGAVLAWEGLTEAMIWCVS